MPHPDRLPAAVARTILEVGALAFALTAIAYVSFLVGFVGTPTENLAWYGAFAVHPLAVAVLRRWLREGAPRGRTVFGLWIATFGPAAVATLLLRHLAWPLDGPPPPGRVFAGRDRNVLLLPYLHLVLFAVGTVLAARWLPRSRDGHS